MANIKSAIKRVEINERNRLRNKSYKSAVKTLIKRYITAVTTYAASPTDESMQEVQRSMASAYSKIDKAVKRGVLHSNNGARKKSRLARLLKRHTAQVPAPTTTASEPAPEAIVPEAIVPEPAAPEATSSEPTAPEV